MNKENNRAIADIKVRVSGVGHVSRAAVGQHQPAGLGRVQGRDLSRVRLIQSESENSLRNRISSDLRKKNPADHFSLIHE